ncbi:MAG: FAD-binding oxidoreductase [Chloroflexota bacterium]
MTTSLATELRSRMRGRVVTADDPDYDELRRVTAVVDTKPPLIARVKGADDVAAAIKFARDKDLEIALRSGGHDAAGRSTTATGIVIDLRDMRAITIDESSHTVRVETGLTALDVAQRLNEDGLAVGYGDTGSVGVGGLTLGGGIGYLSRKWGLTIDALLEVELVTAAGERLTVDGRSNPELFWALRGGGGNFGVATAFRYAPYPLKRVYGGMLLLPATAQTVAQFVAMSAAAPDELTTIANVMACPPMPFVDEAVVGTPVIMSELVYAGEADAAEPVVTPFRKIATPLADFIKPLAYHEIWPPEDPNYRPTAESRNMFMKRVDEATARRMLDLINASDSPMRGAQLRVHGGAIARVPSDATAFAHRSAPIMVNVFCFYNGEADRPGRAAWVREMCATLDQGEPGVYVNFLGDEGPDRLQAAYPGATLDRLRAVKKRLDPDNVFHRNNNILPA